MDQYWYCGILVKGNRLFLYQRFRRDTVWLLRNGAVRQP